MSIDDLAPVNAHLEDRPHSEVACYYSYRTNTLYLNISRDHPDYQAVVAHELSHYFLHVSTPYGFFLPRLSSLSDSCVLDYCMDFQAIFGKRRIPYPIYSFSREWYASQKSQVGPTANGEAITRLIEKHVKPWSRFKSLLKLIEGRFNLESVEQAQDFIKRSHRRVLDYFIEAEAMESNRFPPWNPSDDLPQPPYARPRISDDTPACPLLTDHLKRRSAFGGHHIFESLAQAVEFTSDITMETFAEYPDYWNLWLATISACRPAQASKDTLEKLRFTFLAICDLSLFCPIGAVYGSLRTDTMGWDDIHPGFRFSKALKAGASVGLLSELSSKELLEYQEKICALLGWPSPRKFVQLGMFLEGDSALEYEHRRAAHRRFKDHSIYLRFFINQVSTDEIKEVVPDQLPLIKPARSETLLVDQSTALDVQSAIEQMVGYFLPQWADAVMLTDHLDYMKFLPAEFIIEEPLGGHSLPRKKLIEIIFEGIPCARFEHFAHFKRDEGVV